MSAQQPDERNGALVLEAFDTLFNKRDYAAAQQFWSPNYIQHSAHIEPVETASSSLSRPHRQACGTRTGW